MPANIKVVGTTPSALGVSLLPWLLVPLPMVRLPHKLATLLPLLPLHPTRKRPPLLLLHHKLLQRLPKLPPPPTTCPSSPRSGVLSLRGRRPFLCP